MAKHIDIVLDTRVYSLEAIRAAIYDISNECAASISIKEINTALIRLELINHVTDPEQIARNFRCFTNDHQLRLDINAKTYKIREIILAQAFAPCENIGEIIKAQQITE